jgi:DNA invertase Pin-like site-specific DNA recombinase
MLIGYARVSTQDQNLDLQIEALTKALEILCEGDILVVWKLGCLGCSVKNLVDLVGKLHKQSIQFRSLTGAIDTGTPSGRFFYHVMASWLKWNVNLQSSIPVQD